MDVDLGKGITHWSDFETGMNFKVCEFSNCKSKSQQLGSHSIF